MMRRLNLDQNTGDWLSWRQKGIGASDTAAILGVSPWVSREEMLARKVSELREDLKSSRGRVPYQRKGRDSPAMARGRRLEPIVRELYEGMTGLHSPPVCGIHDEIDWLRVSLDGLSDDPAVALEIKCPKWTDHLQAVEGGIPAHYYPQVQHQLLVSGVPLLHYVSYTDNTRFPIHDRFALVEVRPNKAYQNRLLTSLREFWEEIQENLLKSDPLVDVST